MTRPPFVGKVNSLERCMSDGVEVNGPVMTGRNLLEGYSSTTPPFGWLKASGSHEFAAALSRATTMEIDASGLYRILAAGICFVSERMGEAVRHVMTGPKGDGDQLLRQLAYFLRPSPLLIQQKPAAPVEEPSAPQAQAPAPSIRDVMSPSWEARWSVGGLQYSIETRRQDRKPLIQYRVNGLVVGEVLYFTRRAEDFDYFSDEFRRCRDEGTLDSWFCDLCHRLGQMS